MQAQNITSFYLKENNSIPNNSKLPLLLYRQAFPDTSNLENQFKDAFQKNKWGGTWVNGVFDYHHYHSVTHEVLGVLAGSATIIFGGPDGEEIKVKAGDMAILPAGTGHCRKTASSDFRVVGAYPKGLEDYDICTEKDNVEEKKENIQQVPIPTTDPITGEAGPLLDYWK